MATRSCWLLHWQRHDDFDDHDDDNNWNDGDSSSDDGDNNSDSDDNNWNDGDNSSDDDYVDEDDVDATTATVKMSIFVSIKNSQGCSSQLDCRHFVDLWFDARLQQMEFRQPLVKVIDPDEKLECFILSKNKFCQLKWASFFYLGPVLPPSADGAQLT